MPKANFRRAILKYSTGKKPVFTGFLVKRSKKKSFLAAKARCLAQLEGAMKLSSRDPYSVAPVLRDCLTKLNKLPFAYTWDSNRAFYCPRSKHLKFSRSPPKGKRYFFYIAPFITIRLDGSKQSFQFWQRLAELVKRYPRACISPSMPSPGFEITHSEGKSGTGEPISRDRLKPKLAEARRFFKELEKIADEFLGK